MKQALFFALLLSQLIGCAHEDMTKSIPHTLAISVGGETVYGPNAIELADAEREISLVNKFCPYSNQTKILKVRFYLNRLDGGLIRIYCSTNCLFGPGEAIYKIESLGTNSTIECDEIASMSVSNIE